MELMDIKFLITFLSDFDGDVIPIKSKYSETHILYTIDEKKTKEICEKLAPLNSSQYQNILIACIIFFYLSNGKYPQDVWDLDARIDKDELEKKIEDYIDVQENKIMGFINEMVEYAKRLNKREFVKTFFNVNKDLQPGFIKLIEMLYDVFIKRYYGYKKSIFINKLQEILNASYNNVYQYNYADNRVEIVASSYEGLLKKPGKTNCEDACMVHFFNKASTSYICAIADGVGSCVNSKEGSKKAISSIVEIIDKYLRKVEKEKISLETKTSRILYYFQNHFAKNLYQKWESEIKKDVKAKIEDFATTIQFVFVYYETIVCAKVGDGNFLITKQIQEKSGYEILTDFISGVTQQSVLSILCLKNHPYFMNIKFYKMEDVNNIIFSTDGVKMLENRSAYEFVSISQKKGFKEKVEIIDRITKESSDYNATYGGTGDDSTTIYIHFLNNK